MTCEAKVRALASVDTTLQGYFGTNPFRWFHIQLPPGYIGKSLPGTCARVRQISQVPIYCQEGMNRLNEVRLQIDVLDPDADTVDEATAAICDWLGTVDFASEDQFESPPTVPTQFPNFVLNIRPGLCMELKPPVPLQSIDCKIFNLDLI